MFYCFFNFWPSAKTENATVGTLRTNFLLHNYTIVPFRENGQLLPVSTLRFTRQVYCVRSALDVWCIKYLNPCQITDGSRMLNHMYERAHTWDFLFTLFPTSNVSLICISYPSVLYACICMVCVCECEWREGGEGSMTALRSVFTVRAPSSDTWSMLRKAVSFVACRLGPNVQEGAGGGAGFHHQTT